MQKKSTERKKLGSWRADRTRRKNRVDYKKWAKKHFSPGSNQIPRTPFNGIGKPKPLICDVCKKQVIKLKGEFYNDKLVNRCEECVYNGIWAILKK